MPSHRTPSQAESRPQAWLELDAGRSLLRDIEGMAIPELGKVFGQYGLYLHASAGFSREIPGNMPTNVIRLHRDREALAGQIRCVDPELPISTASLSLVYSVFMLESSPDPEALLREIARTLMPEGVALVVSLNPWSLARLRWLRRSGRVIGDRALERMARDAGLDVIRRQRIGPWLPGSGRPAAGNWTGGWLDGIRAASLLVLRQREVGLTPLRKASPAVSLRPGMSAG